MRHVAIDDELAHLFRGHRAAHAAEDRVVRPAGEGHRDLRGDQIIRDSDSWNAASA